jgi:hypothetical protein
MKLTTTPFVSAEYLLALRTLLRAQSLVASSPDRVHERHRPTPLVFNMIPENRFNTRKENT